MGVEERQLVDRLLEELEHPHHEVHADSWAFDLGSLTVRSTQQEPLPDVRLVFGQGKSLELLSHLRRQIALALSSHMAARVRLIEEQFRDLTPSTATDAIKRLEAEVRELRMRVARLEQAEVPFSPLHEDGDPYELLGQLKDEIGVARIRWFTNRE